MDRRRRVLVDESRNDEVITRPRIFRGDDEGPLSRYDESALQALNAPVARYIPFRQFSLVIWFLVGWVPIMGLLLLDQRRFQLSRVFGEETQRIFALHGHGSLSSWCAALAFLVAGLLILAIYSVRRHRRDDYRARFAVWQWVFLLTIFASVESVTGMSGLCQGLAATLFADQAWSVSVLPVLAWGSVFSIVAIRLTLEMKACRPAIGWLLGCGMAYLGYGILESFAVANPGTATQQARGSLLLVGHHLLVFSLVTYAREVVREAMGITAAIETAQQDTSSSADLRDSSEKSPNNAAAGQPKLRAFTADDASTEASPTRSQAKPTKASAKSKRTTKNSSADDEQAKPKMKVVGNDDSSNQDLAGSQDAGSEELDATTDLSKLSRAERKRLKKEMRRRKAA